MTIKLLFQMIFGVFSFNPKNMRWINLRRLLMVLFFFPFFLSVFIVNRFFLWLDFVIFPRFLKQKVEEPVFIISAPRSATTFLFHKLAQREYYTCFKLWEIAFAPSICQKYLFLCFIWMDNKIGHPCKSVVLFLEDKILGNLKKIHLIGLNLPEEDEAVLLWSLSSFYLYFFYPDSHFFDDMALFDKELPAKRKQRIMSSYAKYIQRHNFVFNRDGARKYLSKNPLMMSKVEGIASVFPDAKILNINRCVSESIPSTIELNRVLYALFTSRPITQEVDKRTFEILLDWFRLCEENLQKHFKGQHLKIDFVKMVSLEEKQINEIALFLGVPQEVFKNKSVFNDKKHKSFNSYQVLSEEEVDKVLNELPFMKGYCRY